MKNILVITSSPRVKGNSNSLVQSFMEGAKEKGHNVMHFDAANKKILPCTACGLCWSKGKPCIFNDDSNLIEEMMFLADTIVFISPIYWYTFNAQMKLIQDKMYPYVSTKKPQSLNIKDAVLISCCHDDSMQTFSGAIETYKEMLKYMNWQDKGQLLVKAVGHIGDVEKTDYLNEAFQLGESL